MPFGLTNCLASFQKLIHRCLGDMHNDSLVFLDDIIIFSNILESHLQKHENAFERLKEYTLILKPSKCHFLKDQIKYLGHVVF